MLSANNKLISMEILNDKLKVEKAQMYFNASDVLNKAVAEAQSADGVSGLSRRALADHII